MKKRTPSEKPLMLRPRFVGSMLALLSLLVYLPVWRHGFLGHDDPEYLVENPVVQRGLTWAGCKWAFTELHAGRWHP